MSIRRVASSASKLALVVCSSFAVASIGGAAGIVPPANPASNLAPHPNFLSSGSCSVTHVAQPCTNPCVSIVGRGSSLHIRFPAFTNETSCTRFVLRAINVARSVEHLTPMVLPTNWYRLDASEQLFVLADLERTARGLPAYVGLNRSLTRAAQWAALRRVDPAVATGFAIGHDAQGVNGIASTLALGFATLEADYVWMYQDGWGGSSATPNMACRSPGAPGCWGHRDQLLGFDGAYSAGVGLHCTTCEMGAGVAVVAGTGSMTDLIEVPAGKPPTMYFTWAKDVVPYLHPSG